MSETQRPNILVFFGDQHRRQAMGCMGDPDAVTPNLDGLSRRGVTFTAACSTYPICVPFRFTLMTGQYAHSRCVPGIEWRMSPAERTLADEFNDGGYDSYYYGKWHLYGGHGRKPFSSAIAAGKTIVPREHQGRWKHWRGFELRNDPFDTWYSFDDEQAVRRVPGYQTDGLTTMAIEELTQRDRTRPFAAVISVEPPHNPFIAPPEYEARWKDRPLTLPPNFAAPDDATKEQWLARRRNYYAMVENLDWNVGRIVAALESSGLAENTVIVFFSDHGELGGAHGLWSKQHPYEESVGIPLIVYDPRATNSAGRRFDDPVCAEDLFPTILGLTGLRPAQDVPGMDISPLVRRESARLDREGVLLEFVTELRPKMPYYEQTWRAFRSQRFKYVVLGDMTGAEPWQFFDLQSDPYELKNLVNDPAWSAEVAHHHRLLRQRLQTTGDFYPLKPAWGCAGYRLIE